MTTDTRLGLTFAILALSALAFSNPALADDSEDMDAPSEVWPQAGSFPNQGYFPKARPQANPQCSNCPFGATCAQPIGEPPRKSVVGRAARQARGGRDRGGDDD